MSNLDEQAITAKAIIESMNAQMLKAAEPMIQKALADIEAEMRRSLAVNTIALIERSTRVEFNRDMVTIVLKGALP